MITSIEIQNYALIESTTIDFSKDLSIITGETGAGKSILLGALGLIMGNRADKKALFDKEKKCIVEATFNIGNYQLNDFFDQNDLDFQNELIIRRELTPSGKSRAFINDTPCTLNILQELCQNLINIHQQFDSQEIQNPDFQLKILDIHADSKALRENYTSSFNELQKLRKKLKTLESLEQQALQEKDYLEFQLKELEEIDLDNLEQKKLEEELTLLQNAEGSKNILHKIQHILVEGDQPIINFISEINAELIPFSEINAEFADISSRISSVSEELKDIAHESNRLNDSIHGDDQRVYELEDILGKLYKIQNKHGAQDLSQLIELRNSIASKVENFNSVQSEISATKNAIKIASLNVDKKGQILHNHRVQSFPALQSRIQNLLGQLGMENARIDLEALALEYPNKYGLYAIQFLFNANKGGNLSPLKGVASGGETSRLALCLKSIIANKSTIPTMVFDEIDSGVSGEIANKMGLILQEISKNQQVVCITHAAQIAAKANQHLFVFKEDTDERTISKIKELNPKDRVLEIAKMISGDPPPQSAIHAAEALITS